MVQSERPASGHIPTSALPRRFQAARPTPAPMAQGAVYLASLPRIDSETLSENDPNPVLDVRHLSGCSGGTFP